MLPAPVSRALRILILAVVILTATIQVGASVAGAQDDYVDGPIAEGVSEGPDPARPLAVTDPAGAGSSEATVVANLGYIVSHMLETAMR